jgi:hypothetical protein
MKSLESLRKEATALASGSSFELWVPDTITVNGRMTRRDLAMASLLDGILALGFMPDGMTPGEGGATYRYRRE